MNCHSQQSSFSECFPCFEGVTMFPTSWARAKGNRVRGRARSGVERSLLLWSLGPCKPQPLTVKFKPRSLSRTPLCPSYIIPCGSHLASPNNTFKAPIAQNPERLRLLLFVPVKNVDGARVGPLSDLPEALRNRGALLQPSPCTPEERGLLHLEGTGACLSLGASYTFV